MAKIDPAFQAAPVLQDEYNPVEFAREAHQEKFQLQKAKYEEQQKATVEGLDKLMLNIKGWEDKSGFQELLGRQQKAIDGFMSLSRKGMNLVNPKTTEEVMAYKALNDYHSQTKQLADQWQEQKTAYDVIQKGLAEDAKLDPSEQKIDHAQTQKNLQQMLDTHSIGDRRSLMENAIVPQPQIADIGKFMKENEDAITKPKKITTYQTNPATNQLESTMTDEENPKLLKTQVADVEKLYKIAPPKVKEAIRRARKDDPENDPAIADGTWLAMQRLPKFKEQMAIKPITKGGNDFKLMNQDVKVSTASKQTNAIPLGDKTLRNHYDFNISKTLIGVPVSKYKDAQVLMGGKWMPAGNEGGLVDANLNYYDADTDSFIFTAKANALDAETFKGQALSIPRTSLDAGFSDLPIKDENGKTIKIKDLHPGTEGRNSVLKNSGVSWK